MGFPRQEYWSGLPFPCPGDLPDPGIEPVSRALAVGAIGRPSLWGLVCFAQRGYDPEFSRLHSRNLVQSCLGLAEQLLFC